MTMIYSTKKKRGGGGMLLSETVNLIKSHEIIGKEKRNNIKNLTLLKQKNWA